MKAKAKRNVIFLNLVLTCIAISSISGAQATTIINGSLFDVSYDETQFLSGGSFGLGGNTVNYYPDFTLAASASFSGNTSVNDSRSFEIIAHSGVTLQNITMNISGYYDNYPDSTILTHEGSLTANGNFTNVYPNLFSSFTAGGWSTSATVNLANTDFASAYFYNALTAFGSGFGDANIYIDSISFNVSATAVPLPPAIMLLASGLLGIGALTRRNE